MVPLGYALEVAKKLKLGDEAAWLQLELDGYVREGDGPTSLGEVLEVAKTSDLPNRVTKYRALTGRVYVQFGDRVPEELPYALFIPHPVLEIERISQAAQRTWQTVPFEGLPKFIKEWLVKTHSPRAPVNVYFTPDQFTSVLVGLRGELARFFASVRLTIKVEINPPSGRASSSVTKPGRSPPPTSTS